jgi:alpha-galactosidase
MPNSDPSIGKRCGMIKGKGGFVQVYEQSGAAVLVNDKLLFRLSLAHGRYTLSPHASSLPCLEARADATYKVGQRERAAWPTRVANWKHTTISDLHGTGIKAEFELVPTTGSSAVSLVVRMYEEQPFALVRLVLTNRTVQPISIVALTPVHAVPRDGGGIKFADAPTPVSFLKNGWQAWCFAGVRHADQRDQSTRLGAFSSPQTLNPLTPISSTPGIFSSDMYAVLTDAARRSALVAGQLSTADQFAAIVADCRPARSSLQIACQADGVPLPPQGRLASEWIYLEPTGAHADDLLANYVEAVAREMHARVPKQVATGWCSWYYFFSEVNEQDFVGNLDQVAKSREEMPLSTVQLDDGFEAEVGDWLDVNVKFPNGLAWLAERAGNAGLRPGVWLAPFIVKPTSVTAREHADWLLRDIHGQPVSSGYNWGQFTQALDPTHPGAQDYVQRVISQAVHEWGFPYLKLDFLFAAALPGRRHDPQTTRAQALRRGLEMVRQAAGQDTFLLGCGSPLGPGVGIFDAMRIGPDVAPDWYPRMFNITALWRDESGMPSARNAIRSTLVRSALHGRWWHNDPDCLLARADDTRLTEDEVQSLASVIGLSGGLVLSSDDLPRLTPDRRRYLTALLPALGERAVPLDLLEHETPELYALRMKRDWGEWTLAGVFNWDDQPGPRILDLARLGLDKDQPHHVFDFWEGLYWRVNDGRLALDSIPAHGGRLLRVCPVVNHPHVVGTTLHVTMGGEVSEWRTDGSTVSAKLDLGRKASGAIWFGLPAGRVLRTATCDGQRVEALMKPGGVWAVPVTVRGAAMIEVTWV